MEEFILKEISIERDGMKVTRSRSTKGHAGIKVDVGSYQLSFHGGDYEERVRTLSGMLRDIANDPCLIKD